MKPALQVGVDHARALGRLGAGAERPRARLGVAGGEERAPAEQVVRGARDARARRPRRGRGPRAARRAPRASSCAASASSCRHTAERVVDAVGAPAPTSVVDRRRAGPRRCSRPTSTGLSVRRNAGASSSALVVGERRRGRAARRRRGARPPARARRSRPRATCRPWRRAAGGTSRPSTDARSASTSSSSSVSRSSRGSVSPVTDGSSNARSTKRMASQSRSEPRNRLPSPSPVLAPFTSAAMSTISKPVYTSFFEFDILPSRSTRSSGTCAMPTVVSVVENGCGGDDRRRAGERVEQARLAAVGEADEAETFHAAEATGAPSRICRGSRPRARPLPCTPAHDVHDSGAREVTGTMSKKTSKRKLRSRRNKANHGKRPNSGRR